MCLKLAFDQDNVFCMSSDMVMAPHSIGMAYHLAEVAPDTLIVGRAEHCGQSYAFSMIEYGENIKHLQNRTITWSLRPSPLGFTWMMPMKWFRGLGGYDEIYMNGYCYEDTDFVMRLWEAGVDFVFCDDIMGFHLEHKRDHLRDSDGKVSRNGQHFKARWGDLNILRDRKFPHITCACDVGLSFMLHEKNEKLLNDCFNQQKLYGQDEPWRAIPVVIKT